MHSRYPIKFTRLPLTAPKLPTKLAVSPSKSEMLSPAKSSFGRPNASERCSSASQSSTNSILKRKNTRRREHAKTPRSVSFDIPSPTLSEQVVELELEEAKLARKLARVEEKRRRI